MVTLAAKIASKWARRLPGLFCSALICLIAAVFLVASPGVVRAEILLKDAVGRDVRLEAPAQRIVTNESLLLYSLALIDPDPVARVAGWARPARIDAGVYRAFRQKFPAIDSIPVVGGIVPSNVSVESILAVRPDLFVVSLWQREWEDVAAQLERAGVPVIFLDSPETTSRGPAEATAFSIRLLGRAIGREEQAQQFATYVGDKYRQIADRLKEMDEKPKVLIDVHAGTLCCYTPGSDNRISHYLRLAGGENLGAEVASGYDGQLSPEFVVSSNPDIYIGTGSPHLGAQGGLVIGGDVDEETARRSLADVTSRNLLGSLSAVQEGRAYAVSHQLAISALNLVPFECFAKWAHPKEMAALDPASTIAELNRRFLAVPLEGTFCVGIEPAPSAP